MTELLEQLTITTQNVELPDGSTVLGGTGTRSFIDGAPALDSAFETPWGDTYNNIVCKSITRIPYYVDGGWKPKFIANYETLIPEDSSFEIQRRPRVEEQRSFSGGVGTVTIDATGGEWRLTDTAEPSGDRKNDPRLIGKTTARVAEGTFSLPKVLNATDPNAFVTSMLPKLGKINAGSFMGFAKGQVLCETFSGSSRISSSGNVQWLFNIIYHWKVVGGGVIEDDWNYIYGPTGWKKPVQTVADASGSAEAINFIYSRGDISVP